VLERGFADFVNTMRLLKARAEFLVNLATHTGLDATPPGFGRVDAFGGARNLLFPAQARPLTAPINYPHLWDIGRTSWYHWDGSTNSLLERNVGQALGLGAVFDRSTVVSTVNVANIEAGAGGGGRGRAAGAARGFGGGGGGARGRGRRRLPGPLRALPRRSPGGKAHRRSALRRRPHRHGPAARPELRAARGHDA